MFRALRLMAPVTQSCRPPNLRHGRKPHSEHWTLLSLRSRGSSVQGCHQGTFYMGDSQKSRTVWWCKLKTPQGRKLDRNERPWKSLSELGQQVVRAW